jgi:hypothetical protein
MPPDGAEPIDNDEIIYRRVFDGQLDSPYAFRPTDHDTTGLSFSRAKYKSPQQIGATGTEQKFYYVLAFRAGDLRNAGLEVEPRPLDGDPGHCEIPQIRTETRKTKDVEDWGVALARTLPIQKHGPYPGTRPRRKPS